MGSSTPFPCAIISIMPAFQSINLQSSVKPSIRVDPFPLLSPIYGVCNEVKIGNGWRQTEMAFCAGNCCSIAAAVAVAAALPLHVDPLPTYFHSPAFQKANPPYKQSPRAEEE